MPRKTKTHEEFVREVNKKYPNKYRFHSNYIDSHSKILTEYISCGHIVNTISQHLQDGAGCPICNRGVRLSQQEFENKFYDMFGKNEYSITGNYINNRTKISVKHNKCNTTFDIIPSNTFGRKTCNCPKCNMNKNHNCIPFVNDIYATNRELYNLLENKEDGHKYKAKSHKKTYFICPYCKSRIYEKIHLVNDYGLNCSCCNTNVSFPERLFSTILNALNIDYIFQFSPKWVSPYRYDFQFNINNSKYIVEMDGSFHYKENILNDMSLEEIKERDDYKSKKANENGYEVIRINCNYDSSISREDYIKNSLYSSKLNDILDLNNINFDECCIKANKDLLEIICDLWNNGCKTSKELMDKLNLSDTTIRRYLYFASNNNLINESISDIKNLNIEYRDKVFGHPRNTPVMCNETKEIFKNIKEATEKYHCNISAYFSEGNRRFAGALPDGTRLTWTKI